MLNSLVRCETVYFKMFLNVPCSVSKLSWNFHENVFICFPLMLLTSRQTQAINYGHISLDKLYSAFVNRLLLDSPNVLIHTYKGCFAVRIMYETNLWKVAISRHSTDFKVATNSQIASVDRMTSFKMAGKISRNLVIFPAFLMNDGQILNSQKALCISA